MDEDGSDPTRASAEDAAIAETTPIAPGEGNSLASSNMTVPLEPATGTHATQSPPQRTIILIGFRGIGKSTLGLIAATHLNRPFIDADRLLSRTAGCSPKEYIAKYSWEQFRDLETQILRQILSEHPDGYLVACGGGVVEREENRSMLLDFASSLGGKVIHITREKEEVIRYLINEKDRPQWGEDLRSVWTRRYPLYEQCSTHTYVSLTARRESNRARAPSLVLKDVERDFMRFIRRLLSQEPVSIPLDKRTYTITVDCPMPQSLDYRTLDAASAGADAIELRVDSLRRPFLVMTSPSNTPAANPGCPESSYVAFAIAHLRKMTSLPIIYSIRTVKAGGSFLLEDYTKDDYIKLATTAFKLGAEFLDIQLDVGQDVVEAIRSCKPPYTRLILSHIDVANELTWSTDSAGLVYRHAVESGADIVRMNLQANSIDDNLHLYSFSRQIAASPVPLIAANSGKHGKMSAIFNTFLTPMFHPLLPSPPVPGQSTFANIQKALLAVGLTQHRAVAADRRATSSRHELQQDRFDHALVMSQGFRILGLPYSIAREMPATFDDTMGGAILSLEASGQAQLPREMLSPAADWTKHIDTVSAPHPLAMTPSDGTAVDDQASAQPQYHNVRSLAIAEVIETGLSPVNAIASLTVALLLGARGFKGREAFFALKHLGIKRIYCFDSDADLLDDQDRIETVHIGSHDTSTMSPKHFPTVIVTLSNSLGDSSMSVPLAHRLFASPTGGTMLELDAPRQRPTLMERLLEESRCREGWVCLNHADVERASVKREFETVTGYRLPLEAFAGQVW